MTGARARGKGGSRGGRGAGGIRASAKAVPPPPPTTQQPPPPTTQQSPPPTPVHMGHAAAVTAVSASSTIVQVPTAGGSVVSEIETPRTEQTVTSAGTGIGQSGGSPIPLAKEGGGSVTGRARKWTDAESFAAVLSSLRANEEAGESDNQTRGERTHKLYAQVVEQMQLEGKWNACKTNGQPLPLDDSIKDRCKFNANGKSRVQERFALIKAEIANRIGPIAESLLVIGQESRKLELPSGTQLDEIWISIAKQYYLLKDRTDRKENDPDNMPALWENVYLKIFKKYGPTVLGGSDVPCFRFNAIEQHDSKDQNRQVQRDCKAQSKRAKLDTTVASIAPSVPAQAGIDLRDPILIASFNRTTAVKCADSDLKHFNARIQQLEKCLEVCTDPQVRAQIEEKMLTMNLQGHMGYTESMGNRFEGGACGGDGGREAAANDVPDADHREVSDAVSQAGHGAEASDGSDAERFLQTEVLQEDA